MDGSGAAMNSKMIGARIGIVGSGLAARCARGGAQRKYRAAEIDPTFGTGGQQPVGTRRARFRCQLGGAPECLGLTESATRRDENVGQLFAHDSSTTRAPPAPAPPGTGTS